MILTSITIPSQNGPESHSKEGVVHIPQSSKTRASLSDAV